MTDSRRCPGWLEFKELKVVESRAVLLKQRAVGAEEPIADREPAHTLPDGTRTEE